MRVIRTLCALLIAVAPLALLASPAEAYPACTQLVRGIDVSNNNGNINWTSVRASGVQFAWVKATEGTTYHDPDQGVNEGGAVIAGIPYGDYHFAHPHGSVSEADAEAAWFERWAGNGGSLPNVLDLETTSLNPTDTAAWAARWAWDVQAATQRPVMIYVGGYFPVAYSSALAALGLWVPGYPMGYHTVSSSCGLPLPHVSASWASSGWQVWQYTSVGRVPGIGGNVDLDAGLPSWFAAQTGTHVTPALPGRPQVTVYSIGSTGPGVTQIQLLLSQLGIDVGGADGDYGPRTAQGVATLQRRVGITADGIWGPQTQATVNNALIGLQKYHYPVSNAYVPIFVPPYTLSEGDRSPNVWALQVDLNKRGAGLFPDGYYGPATANAVRNLQRVFHLTPDGVYGPKTRAALSLAI